jgi:hypothetical protein
MLIGTMTIIEVFIPVAFMIFIGIIFMHIWDCAIIPDAFMGIITIMGIIIMHVMLAGQAVIIGFIAIFGPFMGIMAMQFIPVGQAIIIFPDVIISPAMGSIATIVTNPINARSMIVDCLYIFYILQLFVSIMNRAAAPLILVFGSFVHIY